MWYSYAIIRVVPRVERGEFLNVGVIVFARQQRFLGVRLALDRTRLAAVAPDLDMATVERHLAMFLAICTGEASGGPIAALPVPERFHWLVAPRSTMIQTSPVHVGRSADPRAALDELLGEFVQTLGAPAVSGPRAGGTDSA